ncbi:MAG: hypothetical protein GX937_10395 [Lentisphaerae bacterium]|nr:hypothetical protein [Lentisphaerota bacterium]
MPPLLVFIIFLFLVLPLIGIIQRIAVACRTSWFRVFLSIFCWVVGFFIYTANIDDSNIISVKSFLMIALIVASPQIIIFVWKKIVTFYKWAVDGISISNDGNLNHD